jgi:hypothetical protein
LEAGDLEQLAAQTYERAGLDPARPVSPMRLARMLLGEDAITRPIALTGAPASLYYLNGTARIAVKKSVPIEYARFFVGHELGHLIVEKEGGYDGDDLEVCCDYFGAALMAPRAAIVAMQRSFGFDLPAIAHAAGSTQTWAALRCAEVLRMPLAVIAPKIRVRGPDEWVWPDEDTLRRWARNPRSLPRGLAKTRLTDDDRRVVLLADDATGST